ncbi:MAG: CoA pyrophosphatase [Erythrobacter sp.]
MNDLHAKLSAALAEGHGRDVGELESDVRFAELDRSTDAAVLIAVTERPRPTIILTQRPQSMRSHPGQVAFPGGKLDPGEDAITAALREADEELALPPTAVKVIGTTDRYHTVTGFDITPVLATIPPDLPFIPNPDEVEAWFEAPLDLLLARDGWSSQEAFWKGEMRRYFEMHYEGFRIWGVTAAIIANLAKRLAWEEKA